jgi:hypothetical protein
MWTCQTRCLTIKMIMMLWRHVSIRGRLKRVMQLPLHLSLRQSLRVRLSHSPRPIPSVTLLLRLHQRRHAAPGAYWQFWPVPLLAFAAEDDLDVVQVDI